MTSTYTPAREVAKALIDAIRADHSMEGLLFPSWSPRLSSDDDRVYTGSAELPPDLALRERLPRIVVAARWSPHAFEQEPTETLVGAVTVDLHVVMPKERDEEGDRLATAAILKVLSTPLSGARIIAAGLALQGDVQKNRIAAFDGAWEWVATFRSASVGVLA